MICRVAIGKALLPVWPGFENASPFLVRSHQEYHRFLDEQRCDYQLIDWQFKLGPFLEITCVDGQEVAQKNLGKLANNCGLSAQQLAVIENPAVRKYLQLRAELETPATTTPVPAPAPSAAHTKVRPAPVVAPSVPVRQPSSQLSVKSDQPNKCASKNAVIARSQDRDASPERKST